VVSDRAGCPDMSVCVCACACFFSVLVLSRVIRETLRLADYSFKESCQETITRGL
jgi:hypothetical protein